MIQNCTLRIKLTWNLIVLIMLSEICRQKLNFNFYLKHIEIFCTKGVSGYTFVNFLFLISAIYVSYDSLIVHTHIYSWLVEILSVTVWLMIHQHVNYDSY